MKQEKNVINYYVLCNNLKNTIRTGWKDWNVKRDRLESVAEHIYGTLMLAIAMKSEFNYDVDIMKVIYMLAIHELGECIIGDITHFEISKDEKNRIEHEAVHKILENLLDREEIESMFLEFDMHKSKEAIFAYQCDKLECDLQCKIYDEENCVDLNDQDSNDTFNNDKVQDLFKKYNSWSKMWLSYDKEKYPFDNNFKKVIDYALDNDLSNGIKYKHFYITDKNGNSNCVVRSLSKVLNLEYDIVYNELKSIANDLKLKENDIIVFEKFMNKYGIHNIYYGKDMKIDNLVLDNASYVVFCYDKKGFYHMVPIINNVLYDRTSDSKNLYAIKIYKKDN